MVKFVMEHTKILAQLKAALVVRSLSAKLVKRLQVISRVANPVAMASAMDLPRSLVTQPKAPKLALLG